MHHVRISMEAARGKLRTEFLLIQNNIYGRFKDMIMKM